MPDGAVLKLQKHYRRRFNEHINWPLTRAVSVGDIGRWSSGKMFSLDTNVSGLGLAVQTAKGPVLSQRAFTSERGAELVFKAQGETPKDHVHLSASKAGVTLDLCAKYACILRASILEAEYISDTLGLEQGLLELGKDSDWWKHRVVITAILRAATATAALSHAKKQCVNISAGVETDVPFDIADAKLKLQIGYQSSDTSVDLLALQPVVAFQISRLRRARLLHSWGPSNVFISVD